MNQHARFLLPACLMLAIAGVGVAQTPPPAPAVVASAASAAEAKPTRRPLTGEALRDSGTFPDDREPEVAKPQIKVPLGRKPPVAAQPASGARDARDDGRGPKVNDGVARCKAQPTPAAREDCLDALRRAEGGATPFGR